MKRPRDGAGWIGAPLAVLRAFPPLAIWAMARGRETIDARRAET